MCGRVIDTIRRHRSSQRLSPFMFIFNPIPYILVVEERHTVTSGSLVSRIPVDKMRYDFGVQQDGVLGAISESDAEGK